MRFPFSIPMPRWNVSSLRVRLSLVVAGVILVSVMATAAWNASETFSRDIANQRELLESAASAYAAAVADPVMAQDRGGTLQLLRGVRDIPDVVQTDIRLADGSVFAQLGSGAILVGRDGYSEEMTAWQVWSADRMKVAVPILYHAEEIGRLNFLADVTGVRAEVLADLRAMALFAVLAAALGIALAQWLIARMTGPLLELTARMNAFAANPTAVHAALVASDTETRILVETFTDMVGSIRERDERIAHHMETLEATVDERTRDLREARDDAEAANAAKSNFLATMSHEIRTPMNGMLVMAEMLTAANLSAKHRRYAEIISRSGQGLLTIIDDILDLSKIEAGRLELEAAAFSPEALVVDIATLFWERAREKQLTLAVYVAPDVPQVVTGDPTRLGQIITNLVNNALKFTDAGGVSIEVSTGTQGTGSALTFQVRDTGIGIPPQKQATVFDAFTQADQSTTRQFGGTGLGLAVCRRLADAMGGDIGVESEEGAGSTFTVRLDLPVVTPVGACTGKLADVRVDVDDAILRPLLVRALEDQGARVVSDAEAATVVSPLAISQGTVSRAGTAGPAIGLSDVGDTASDRLLQSGRLVDLLPLPYRREDVAALVERVRAGAFRGVDALAQAGRPDVHRTFEGVRVLAVDDSAINREVLREALGLLGVTATFAENGQQAIDRITEQAFDLVFMDGAMPVMDGLTATRHIRDLEARQSRGRVAVYALTAGASRNDAEAWSEAGADGYIAKPFTIERLAGVLDTIGGAAGPPVPSVAGEEQVETDRPDGSAQPATSLLDNETMTRLDAMGARSGRDVRARLWRLFVLKAPEVADRIHAALEADDGPELVASTHALKSMALSAGANRLAAACQDLETLAQSPADKSSCTIAAGAVIVALEDTITAMNKLKPVRDDTHEQRAIQSGLG